MNTLVRVGFTATRQPNNDVWIVHGRYGQMKLIIPKEDRAELAKLLMWPVVPESHKVDYAISVNEPE